MSDRVVVDKSGRTLPSWLLTPQPLPTTKRDPNFPLDRLLEKIDKPLGDSTACWEWNSSRFEKGYGAFWYLGQARLAHRVLWEYKYGPIPAGLVLLHRCDNPPCCHIDLLGDPEGDHHFLGTVIENNTDRRNKGRTRGGSVKTGENRRVSEDDIVRIRLRAEAGESVSSLAREFGFSVSAMSRLVNRKTYQNIP